MMRVYYDHQAFSSQHRGGIAKYFAALATQPTRDVSPVLPWKLSTNEHFFEMGGRGAVALGRFRGAYRAARLANSLLPPRVGAYDLWHSTYYDKAMLDRVAAPMVMTVHDMIPELFPQHFAANPHEGKRDYVDLARLVIAVSGCTRDDLIRSYGVDAAKIRIVHHGIDLQENSTAALPLPDEFLLFIGKRTGYKNFARMLDAYKQVLSRHPSLHLVCIGGGAFSADERQQMEDAAGKVVEIVGASDAQVRTALSRARAFVFPSLYEGFGLPLLEAMVQRCPLVIANASCFPEIAQDCAIYFDPHDEDDIADAIERAIGDTERRQDLIDKAALLVRDFALSVMIDRTAAVYREALG